MILSLIQLCVFLSIYIYNLKNPHSIPKMLKIEGDTESTRYSIFYTLVGFGIVSLLIFVWGFSAN